MSDLAADPAGNLYVAEYHDSQGTGGALRKITPAGVVTTLAAFGGLEPRGLAVSAVTGAVHVALDDGSVVVVSANGVVAPDGGMVARETVSDLAFDSADNLYLLYGSGEVDRVSPDRSTVVTLSGFAPAYLGARSLAVDAAGTLFITSENSVYTMTPAGVAALLAGPGGYATGTLDGSGTNARSCTSWASPSRQTATCWWPTATTTPCAGSARPAMSRRLSADWRPPAARTARRTWPGSTASTAWPSPAAAPCSPRTACATARSARVASDGTVATLAGTAGKGFAGGPLAQAKFYDPHGIAVSPGGSFYVADTDNCALRLIRAGWVSTFAQCPTQVFPRFPLGDMKGLVISSTGSIFVVSGHMIQVVQRPSGVTSFAGSTEAGYQDGSGPAARFNQPNGLAIDAADNLYVADGGNAVIRKITPQGVVSTLAGAAGALIRQCQRHRCRCTFHPALGNCQRPGGQRLCGRRL